MSTVPTTRLSPSRSTEPTPYLLVPPSIAGEPEPRWKSPLAAATNFGSMPSWLPFAVLGIALPPSVLTEAWPAVPLKVTLLDQTTLALV